MHPYLGTIGIVLIAVAFLGRGMSHRRAWVRVLRRLSSEDVGTRRTAAAVAVEMGLGHHPDVLLAHVGVEDDDVVLDEMAKEALASRIPRFHSFHLVELYVWAYRRAEERGFLPRAAGEGAVLDALAGDDGR